MQQRETANEPEFTGLPDGRILALDPGTKRTGAAVCDELRVTTCPVEIITVSSWKKLLKRVKELVAELDAVAVVVGLPLATDGGESEMSGAARDMARKLRLSLDVPVFLQDERATSWDAKGRLWSVGKTPHETRGEVDAHAAALILADFLDRLRLTHA